MPKEIVVALISAASAVIVALLTHWLRREPSDEKASSKEKAGAAGNPANNSNTGHAPDQVAALCYRRSATSIEFLLVKTDGGRWIFPKGNVEGKEELWQGAEREAFEEAGASGDVSPKILTTFLHGKRGLKRRTIELTVALFPLLVTHTQEPREQGRNPTWFNAQKAIEALREDRDHKYRIELERVIKAACALLA